MSFSSGMTALVAGLGLANLVPALGLKRRRHADGDQRSADEDPGDPVGPGPRIAPDPEGSE